MCIRLIKCVIRLISSMGYCSNVELGFDRMLISLMLSYFIFILCVSILTRFISFFFMLFVV